jgi:hypothetical protein
MWKNGILSGEFRFEKLQDWLLKPFSFLLIQVKVLAFKLYPDLFSIFTFCCIYFSEE